MRSGIVSASIWFTVLVSLLATPSMAEDETVLLFIADEDWPGNPRYVFRIYGEDVTPAKHGDAWVLSESTLLAALAGRAHPGEGSVSDVTLRVSAGEGVPWECVCLALMAASRPAISIWRMEFDAPFLGKVYRAELPRDAGLGPEDTIEEPEEPEEPRPHGKAQDIEPLRIRISGGPSEPATYRAGVLTTQDRAELAAKVRDFVEKCPGVPIEIESEADVPYRDFLVALEVCQETGIDTALIRFSGLVGRFE